MLLQWLDGEEPEPTEQSARVIGETLARLHLLSVPAGNWWRRENPIGRSACAGLVAASGSESVGAFRFFSEEFAELREQLDESLPTGLIHGDVFPDNTLFKDGELVAILDFETTCEEALLFDVAMAIHGFCFPREQWTPGFAEALLAGYGDVRPLEKIEYEALPTYLHWCPLAMMGWHLRELAARRNERNEIRAAQLGDRVTTMKAHPWRP